MLEERDIKLLRRPFTTAAVKFRPAVKKPDSRGRVRCLTYIDARLASERLNEVDPGYRFGYEFLVKNDNLGAAMNFPVLGTLSVKGVERWDVGQTDSSNVDDKYAKTAVSDALKRVAVLFGVGAYLYALGDAFVSDGGYWKKADGSVGGLNEKGIAELRAWYDKRINSKDFADRFGKPVDYGDILTDSFEVVEDTTVAEKPKRKPRKKKSDDVIVAAVGSLAELSGKSRDAAEKWAANRDDKTEALRRAVESAASENVKREDIESVVDGLGFAALLDTLDGVEVTPGS